MIDQKHGQGTLGDDASYNAIGQAPLPAGCLMSPEDNGFALSLRPARGLLLAVRAERTPHQGITLDFLPHIALLLFDTHQHKFVVDHDRLLAQGTDDSRTLPPG